MGLDAQRTLTSWFGFVWFGGFNRLVWFGLLQMFDVFCFCCLLVWFWFGLLRLVDFLVCFNFGLLGHVVASTGCNLGWFVAFFCFRLFSLV